MPQNKINILCTRPLEASLIAKAATKGIAITVLPFIDTAAIQSIEIQQEIELALTETATVVFTSMNAVEAVATYLYNDQPNWRIYSIGNTTKELIEQYFGEHTIAGTANSAAALAEQIVVDDATDNIIFFCGDQRRNELPDILQKADINIQEVVVYQTILQPYKIEQAYHGILFFSPSAVHSFFINNTLPTATILFAIGSTTATTIKQYCSNKIFVSPTPAKEKLVEEVMDFFVSDSKG
jgi:uroporphyrinogen-III synthase